MRIKTYLEPTIEKALKRIRSELGPDAIIISTVNEGNLVRVSAAGEEVQPTLQPVTAVIQPDLSYEQWQTVLRFHRIPPNIIDDIAQILLNQLTGSQPLSFKKIIEPYLSKSYLEPKSLILVGASGIGKSLTLAKLASEYKIKGIPVCIITCDPFKAGAIEQMQQIAGVQNIDVHIANNYHELDDIIKQQSVQKYCLIDTPGINPLSTMERALIQDFLTFSNAEPLLILSAGIDACEHMDHVEAFKELNVRKFMMTRIDTAQRYGNLITTLVKNKLSLVGWSNGNTLGHRIVFPSSNDVVDLLIKNQDLALNVPSTLQPKPTVQKPEWRKISSKASL